jgi:hypothetical protein
LIEKQTNEDRLQRLKRLAHEEEFLNGRFAVAEQYHQELLKADEGNPNVLREVS